ncbi:MAG TPA: HAMP domain-containing protein, partial [Solirubrobacteraceae bacterium]|nr:HAMP domain-containing protein [Solirubrobacteraceae bacterium]
MNLVGAWLRQLLQAGTAAALVPVAMVAALVVVLVGAGGFGGLGALGQLVGGPQIAPAVVLVRPRLQIGRRDLRPADELAERAEAAEAAGADEHDDERRDDRHGHEGRGRPGPQELAQPCADKVHDSMIGLRDATGKRSIAGTLQLALLGLTIVLAIIGAIGIGALYEARQDYENELAQASALEVAAANLLASTVALEANLARPRSRRAARFVAAAARSFDDVGRRAAALSAADDRSRTLAAPVGPARRTAAALAVHPTIDATRSRATRNLRAVRGAVERIADRQAQRRDEARDRATDRSRSALLAIGFGAGFALVGVLAFLTLLIRNMRRPLDDLVGATRRMSSGDLTARVKAGGPKELEAVGRAFNAMGAELATASERVEAQRQRLATTIQSLGDGLVICDNLDRVVSLNPRATELVPGLRVGSLAHGPGSPLPQLSDALAREVTVRREGDLTLAVTAARLAGPEGGAAWTLRDITERARLEQAKSDFVATASHELRSPLTSIKGFIELLQSTDNQNLTERQQEFI